MGVKYCICEFSAYKSFCVLGEYGKIKGDILVFFQYWEKNLIFYKYFLQ
jgi:hypothetical protein